MFPKDFQGIYSVYHNSVLDPITSLVIFFFLNESSVLSHLQRSLFFPWTKELVPDNFPKTFIDPVAEH